MIHINSDSHFEGVDWASPDFNDQLIQRLTKILKTGSKPDRHSTFSALSDFFEFFHFDFAEFIGSIKLSSKESDQYFTSILYEIFHDEFFINYLKDPAHSNSIDFLLLSFLPEVIDEIKLNKIIQRIPLKKQLNLLVYCLTNMREGSWLLLETLEGLKDEEWKSFVCSLRNKYFDEKVLAKLIEDNGLSFEEIVQKLDAHATSQVQDILSKIDTLIDVIIDFPMKVYEIFAWHQSEIHQKVFDLVEFKKISLQSENDLKKNFLPFIGIKYPLDKAQSFFQIFGLRGHHIPFLVELKMSFLDIINFLFLFWKEPPANPEHTNLIPLFVYSFLKQIKAFCQVPQEFIHGLERIVYACATRGDRFSTMEWLPSVIKGLDAVVKVANKESSGRIKLSNFPVIIFDQSNKSQFLKNQKYINDLNERYQSKIIHVSKKETLQLAKKLGIVNWIKTQPKGNLGYGGARNCLFFLAPVIAEAFKNGAASFKDILNNNQQLLVKIFRDKVLGINCNDSIIHVGEDDVFIPTANIFSDALLAETFHKEYFCRPAYIFGRSTQYNFPILDSTHIVEKPSYAFYSVRWRDEPFSGSLKGMISKPKFCLPNYFECEEMHTYPPVTCQDYFQQSTIHFAGSRFPKKLFPRSSFDGLMESFVSTLPTSLRISMVSSLLDQLNARGKCIFPWKDSSGWMLNDFRSLQQLILFASKKETINEIQNRFWNNLLSLFQNPADPQFPIGKDVAALLVIKQHPDMPIELLKYYEEMRIEAQIFFAFGKALIKHKENSKKLTLSLAKEEVEKKFQIKLSDTQITKDLYNLILSINKLKESFATILKLVHNDSLK